MATSAEGRRDQAACPARHAGQRSEELGIDADRHEAHPVERHAHVGVDVLDRVLADHHDPRQLRRDLALHLDEGVPAPDGDPLVEVGCRSHLERAVARDRVVERDDQRDLLLELGDAVAEALVVVDQIELAEPLREMGAGAGTERERLGELPGGEHGRLEQVVTGREFPERREPAGVVIVEQVEARQSGERNAVVEYRVRLSAEHLDPVAQIDQRLGEVPGVDALPADVGFATVGQVGDRQRGVVIETCLAGHHDRLPVRSYRPVTVGTALTISSAPWPARCCPAPIARCRAHRSRRSSSSTGRWPGIRRSRSTRARRRCGRPSPG